MTENWNVLEMANSIAHQLWKPSIYQNVAPAARETVNGKNILQKLGISWIPSNAPAFYLNSKNVKILHEPQVFYKLLLQEIENANKRIVFSSLYLGTGKLEKNLVLTLQNKLSKKPDLKVKILLDCTRGSRGEINSRKMLLPLLKSHNDSCEVSLYQTAYLQGPLIPYLPTKYQEIAGLQHIKVYLCDDNCIISGANLSNDYFTNRQDRYMFIKNNKELCDFVEGLIDKVSEFSFHLNANDTLTLKNTWQHDPKKTNPKTFNLAASTCIKEYYNNFINRTEENKNDCDTVIFPLLEMGPFDIHADSTVTKGILENCSEENNVYLTTGYFNLTESYISTIIDKSKGNFKILMAHPTTNGFHKANWPAGGIPYAYTYLASKFLKQIHFKHQSHRIKMFEFKRPNWTYHAKGLWLSTSESELPFITMIGSPNFGERSVNHDLECQFLLATTNENLQYDLLQERKLLYDFSHVFSDHIWTEPDREIPYWVKAVVLLFRSYL